MTAPSTSRHLVTTTPRRDTCHRCKRVVLDGHEMGSAYRVDAIPLNLAGELDARLEGRNTYRVLAGRIVLREPLDIAADATKGRPPVCATHSCAPVAATHIEATRAEVFLRLTAEAPPELPEQAIEQHSLFVITGAFAGARVTAIPADDTDRPPF